MLFFLVTTAADSKKANGTIAELPLREASCGVSVTAHDLSHTQQLSLYDGAYHFVMELDVSQDCSHV